MEESSEDSSGDSQSWFEKLSHFIMGEPKDRKHLFQFLKASQQKNLFNADAMTMIEGVLQVSEMHVREIMIPRSQMVVGSREQTPEELLPIVISSGHSRFPVIGDSRDEIVGILMAKDLLRYFVEHENPEYRFDIREVMRLATFVPESKRLDVLLKEFRESKSHMAIVVDEYGGVAGLVTIEDVLEQIVGEIDDEHDLEDGKYILRHDDNRFMVKALTEIEDFNEYFGTNFDTAEFDTIGGLVTARFGRLPSRGEKIDIESMSFEIVRADTRKIHLLMAEKK
ncbi:MAG: CBS domain-containing protein [Gammaproteobacteria bacterium]|nr:MAG: CBS domain-containing protein [Gammaproteobacteria bacterium]